MSDLRLVWILAGVVLAPVAANAADDPDALRRKADAYAFAAKQYGAAGKPLTNAIAKRYADWSRSYRARATEAQASALR